MRDRDNRIKLEDCVHRKLYRVDARNLKIAVFNGGNQEFIGIREKFGARFLDHEFHWDAVHHPTCCPMQVIGELPKELDPVVYYPGSQCGNCKTLVDFRKFDEADYNSKGEWYHKSQVDCTDIRPCTINNDKLLHWLERQEIDTAPESG